MVNSQHTFSTRRLAGSDMQHLSRHPHRSFDFEPLVLCTFDQISTDCDSQRKTRNMLGFSLSMIMQKTCSDQEKKVRHVPNRMQWWVSSQCQHVDDYFDHSRYMLKPHSINTTMFQNKPELTFLKILHILGGKSDANAVNCLNCLFNSHFPRF